MFPHHQIAEARGYEIDPHYGEAARLLWRDRRNEIVIGDFTQVLPPEQDDNKYNLVICNPPYVRHHHLPSEDKKRLQAQTARIIHVTTQPVSIQKINLSPMTYRVNEYHIVESMPYNGHFIYP